MAVAKIHIALGQGDEQLLDQAIENLQSAIKIVEEKYKYKRGYPIAEGNLKWAYDEKKKFDKK